MISLVFLYCSETNVTISFLNAIGNLLNCHPYSVSRVEHLVDLNLSENSVYIGLGKLLTKYKKTFTLLKVTMGKAVLSAHLATDIGKDQEPHRSDLAHSNNL